MLFCDVNEAPIYLNKNLINDPKNDFVLNTITDNTVTTLNLNDEKLEFFKGNDKVRQFSCFPHIQMMNLKISVIY